MYAAADRQRRVLIAATLLFWAAWIGVFGILPTGDSSGAPAGALTDERSQGPAPSASDAHTRAALPTLVPSPAPATSLRGQSPGGGQGPLSTALRTEGAPFPAALGRTSAFRGWEPGGRFRSARRSPEHLPRPPPDLSETG